MNSRERFLAAAACQPVDRMPVWLMRQAGRYLPEYRELREKYSFVEMSERPELAIEISLQPLCRFDMDAVIFFSDILTPLKAFGITLSFEEGSGPKLDRKISTEQEVDALSTPAAPAIRRQIPFALTILEELRMQLREEKALLGFVGAPWTIACYMIEGGSGGFTEAVRMAEGALNHDRGTLEKLLDRITDLISLYAVEQVRAGADAVQIFDTWAGLLEPKCYAELALPRIKKICAAIESAGGIPIYFIKESEKHLGTMKDSGAKVVSLGSGTDLTKAWEFLGRNVATQGNLDPEILLGSAASVVSATQRLLDVAGKRPGHIMNLGHGILKGTKPECVQAFVETVKDSSAK